MTTKLSRKWTAPTSKKEQNLETMAEEKSVLEDVISGLLTNPAFLDIINKQIIKSQEKL